MSKKRYFGLLMLVVCLAGIGYDGWRLYGKYQTDVFSWKEKSEALFEKALLMELDKRGNIPVRVKSSGQSEVSMLNVSYPDTVVVAIGEEYHWVAIPEYKTENSLMKDMRRRTIQGILLQKHPVSIDTLTHVWDSFLVASRIPFRPVVRYIYTDLERRNDTILSSDNKDWLSKDSLIARYMGARCEYEFVGYVVVPSFGDVLNVVNVCLWLLPFIILGILFRFHSTIRQKLISEKVVEKEIHLADVQVERAKLYKLPDGMLFDSLSCTLRQGGVVHNISPQSANLLKLFLRKDLHRITTEEIDDYLWAGKGSNDQLRNAVYRLRKELKHSGSSLIIQNVGGTYELKISDSIE